MTEQWQSDGRVSKHINFVDFYLNKKRKNKDFLFFLGADGRNRTGTAYWAAGF